MQKLRGIRQHRKGGRLFDGETLFPLQKGHLLIMAGRESARREEFVKAIEGETGFDRLLVGLRESKKGILTGRIGQSHPSSEERAEFRGDTKEGVIQKV